MLFAQSRSLGGRALLYYYINIHQSLTLMTSLLCLFLILDYKSCEKTCFVRLLHHLHTQKKPRRRYFSVLVRLHTIWQAYFEAFSSIYKRQLFEHASHAQRIDCGFVAPKWSNFIKHRPVDHYCEAPSMHYLLDQQLPKIDINRQTREHVWQDPLSSYLEERTQDFRHCLYAKSQEVMFQCYAALWAHSAD